MASSTPTAAERYAAVVESFLHHDGVSHSSDGAQPKSGFGASALKVDGKIFALLSSKGQFVVKIPRQRVLELVAAGDGEPYDPGHGRLMREWLALAPSATNRWLPLATEAMHFVAGSKSPR